jgi:hypothetical protein
MTSIGQGILALVLTLAFGGEGGGKPAPGPAIPAPIPAKPASVSGYNGGFFGAITKAWRAMFKSNNRSGYGANSENGNISQRGQVEEIKQIGRMITGTKDPNSTRDPDVGFQIYLLYGAYAMMDPHCYVGNCGEMSASLFRHIYMNYPDVEVNLVTAVNADHTFLFARANGQTFLLDPWNGQSIAGANFDGTNITGQGGVVLPGYEGAHTSETGWRKNPEPDKPLDPKFPIVR